MLFLYPPSSAPGTNPCSPVASCTLKFRSRSNQLWSDHTLPSPTWSVGSHCGDCWTRDGWGRRSAGCGASCRSAGKGYRAVSTPPHPGPMKRTLQYTSGLKGCCPGFMGSNCSFFGYYFLQIGPTCLCHMDVEQIEQIPQIVHWMDHSFSFNWVSNLITKRGFVHRNAHKSVFKMANIDLLLFTADPKVRHVLRLCHDRVEEVFVRNLNIMGPQF